MHIQLARDHVGNQASPVFPHEFDLTAGVVDGGGDFVEMSGDDGLFWKGWDGQSRGFDCFVREAKTSDTVSSYPNTYEQRTAFTTREGHP